ncbi:hypothetical protein OG259_04310 [Streptomyces sp. NBC_00250]|uniref:hypothetical protein n=1 Tax=Streptomyces sp. NBC_00250 TaxID=2903641 RepID=UPI002E2E8484|nr:hypothetical protein [Streptomyces sp. NBC_00250]
MSVGRGLPMSTRPSIPESYETEAVAMEPFVTVGLDGSPESMAAARRSPDQELHPGLVIAGNPVADDTRHAPLKAASEFAPTVLGSFSRPHG